MANCKVIAVANQKGGVGKSTSVYCIGAGLAMDGKRVLLVDVDPQGDLTKMLGQRKPHELPHTLAEQMNAVVQHSAEPEHPEILHHHEGFDFVPANRSLSAVEVGLVNVMSRETVLKRYLDGIKKNYDYVLLDCRPSLGMLVINALSAADHVLIPVQADYLAAEDMTELVGTVQSIRQQINPKLKIGGVFLTMANDTNFRKDIVAGVKENFGKHLPVLDAVIPAIVWDNKLIDGHHRRQIILKHPELPFQIKEVAFNNKYEAIAWICKNQAGRRNLTSEQLSYLIGKRYQAEKQSRGSQERFQRKDSDESPKGKIYPLEDTHATAIKIADENGISEKSVRLFGEYAKGVDAAEAACPGVKQELLSGSFKPTKPEVIALSKLPANEVADKLSEYRREQAEREAKRQKDRDEKRRRAEEAKEAGKQFTSISELSANMAEPKRRNDVSNVIGIISDAALEMKDTCETHIAEFPQLMKEDKPLLLQALKDLKEYLNEIFKEE